jgi:hypothetical protein
MGWVWGGGLAGKPGEPQMNANERKSTERVGRLGVMREVPCCGWANRGFACRGTCAASSHAPQAVSCRRLLRSTLWQRIWRVARCIALTPGAIGPSA